VPFTPPTSGKTTRIPLKQQPEVTPTQRVQESYKQLAQAALSLNSASDELGKAISVLDAALKKLNLGVSAWVTLSQNDGGKQGQDWWWARQFGYTKVRDKWGVALRSVSGDHAYPDGDSEEAWLYNDAPRWMRTEAVAMIPDLLEALLKQAQDTTKGIEKKTAQALELAGAIDALAQESQPAEQK
jgi:hypothetical protein